MEKVHSNIDESNVATLINDLSKRTIKSGLKSKNDINFKDFIKPKNYENNGARNSSKNTATIKDDFKDVKRNVNDQANKRNDFKAQNNEDRNVKDDNSSNTVKTVSKDKTNTSSKLSKKENKLNEKIDEKRQEDYDTVAKQCIAIINDPTLKPEQIAQKLKELFSDLNINQAEFIESISKLSSSLADNIKDILSKIDNINSDDKLKELINAIKVDEDFNKITKSIDSNSASILDEKFSKSEENPLDDIKNFLDEQLDKSKTLKEMLAENKNSSKQLNEELENVKIDDNSNQGLKDALMSLKNDMFKTQLNQSQNNQEVLNETIESQEDINLNQLGLNTPTVKILGQTKSTFTTGIVNNNSINLATFSKILDEMRIAFRDNKTSFTMKLEPETLGKMSVKINSENGIFNASFFVESQKVKQIIENQIVMLRQAMLDKGINIQDINVQVGQNNEDLNYHKHIMEAKNYSKRDNIDIDTELNFDTKINPYIKDELFDERV